MKSRAAPSPAAKRSLPRAAMVGVPVVFVLIIVAVLIAVRASRSASSGPPATPTFDPRLIVHPQYVPLSGNAGGVTLHGSLYPGYPGRNTLRVTPAAGAIAPGSYLELVAVMPGMGMIPVKGRLAAANGAYKGDLSLPMFGNYVATVTLVTGTHRLRGTAYLSLPLTVGR
ncbi:MAG TPA: hypothetical protein VNL35_14310 [Chloroflexota bacterium]|nr:hypothetical protein [Chloroflexota bacterium]